MHTARIKRIIPGLLIALGAAIVNLTAKYIYAANEPLKTVYGISQILRLLPEFSLVVAIPFALLCVFMLLPQGTNITRLFYFSTFITTIAAAMVQTLLIKLAYSDFGIFKIIAYVCGAFADMIIYEYVISTQQNKVDSKKK